MPDKYVCDCGFSSNEYIEVCPECGFPITVIDIDDDVESGSMEKYSVSELTGIDSDSSEEEDSTSIKIPRRKAA